MTNQAGKVENKRRLAQAQSGGTGVAISPAESFNTARGRDEMKEVASGFAQLIGVIMAAVTLAVSTAALAQL
jgi:hypothetical protein